MQSCCLKPSLNYCIVPERWLRYSSVTVSVYDCSDSGKSLSFCDRKSDVSFRRHKRYGLHTISTAGLLVSRLTDLVTVHFAIYWPWNVSMWLVPIMSLLLLLLLPKRPIHWRCAIFTVLTILLCTVTADGRWPVSLSYCRVGEVCGDQFLRASVCRSESVSNLAATRSNVIRQIARGQWRIQQLPRETEG